MKLVKRSFLITVFLSCLVLFSNAETYAQSASYDELDPRLPDYRLNLLYRLQVSAGHYLSNDFSFLKQPDEFSGINRELASYIAKSDPYRFNYKLDDFKFSAGLKIKEDWLGIKESDSTASNLQTVITIKGKAIIKDKIEFYQDILLFRSDTTSSLDNVSSTGEFLKNPLLSYQLPHRGPVASDVNAFDVQTERAFIRANIYGIDVRTGRDRIQFKGGYRNGLLFSGLTRPVDLFYRFDYKVWRFGFTALTGQLTDSGKRYISAKRVTLRLARNLRIGATEAVAYADDPTAYINPMMLFFITHRHQPTNDENLIASTDISYTPFKNLNLYGEFLDDDFIIFGGGASKYGFLFGLYKSQLLSERTDFRLEYSQVRKWTYTHVSDINIWEYRDRPFGFWLGPDADELYSHLSYFISPETGVEINFNYVRKGEGDIYHPYEDEWGDKHPPFPSGIVEKSIGGWIDLRHEYSKFIFQGRFGFRRIDNRHNQPGNCDSYFGHVVMKYNL